MPPFTVNPNLRACATRNSNLGKRVLKELAGNQVFKREPITQEYLPWRIEATMVPERATVAKTAELLGLSSYAVRRIAKAYEKGGAARWRASVGAEGA